LPVWGNYCPSLHPEPAALEPVASRLPAAAVTIVSLQVERVAYVGDSDCDLPAVFLRKPEIGPDFHKLVQNEVRGSRRLVVLMRIEAAHESRIQAVHQTNAREIGVTFGACRAGSDEPRRPAQ
jgi:hypothetical protein